MTLTPSALTPAQTERLRLDYALASGGVAPDVTAADAIAAQLTRADLATMTPAQVDEARRGGRLLLMSIAPEAFGNPGAGEALGTASPAADGGNAGQLTRADLAGMGHREITQAWNEGRLSVVTGGQRGAPSNAETIAPGQTVGHAAGQ